ncbi:MAG TPA: DUF11 domain-containing protein [Verrucomicrobiae bacterium]|jgi:uncharacterized repeat protein (TIGR01451 family)
MKIRQIRFWAMLSLLALVPAICFAAPPSADLSVSANYYTGRPSSLGQGETYTLTISNAGPDTATGVILSDQIPANVRVSDLSAGEAIVTPDGRVTIGFNTLPAGQSLTFDIVEITSAQFLTSTKSVNPIDLFRTTVTNKFVVLANEADPVPANNTAATVIDVVYSFPGTPSSKYDLKPLQLTTSNRVYVFFSPDPNDDPTFYGGAASYEFPYGGVGLPSGVPLSFDIAYPGDVVILGGSDTNSTANTDITNWLAVIRFFNPGDPTGIEAPANEKQAFFPTSIIGPDGFTNFTLFPNVIYVTGSTTSSNGFATASVSYGAEAIPYYYYLELIATHSPTGVRLTASSTPEPVVVGNDLTYLLAISNSMPRLATDVTISNLLPANLSFVSVTGGTVTTNKGALLINAGSLGPGATNLITLVVKPNTVENLTNVFHVSADQPDPDPNAGFATVVSTVNGISTQLSADVSVTTTNFSPNYQYIVFPNSTLTCWLTVSNAGPATATGLTLRDFIPPNVSFVSATGGNATSNNGVITINLASLPAGATNQVQIVVQPSMQYLNTSLITTASFLTNFYEVSDNEPDPVAGNNTTNVVVDVIDFVPGTPVNGPGTNKNNAGAVIVLSASAENDLVQSYFTDASLYVDNDSATDSVAIPGDLVLLNGTNGGNKNIANWASMMRFFNPADPDGTLGLPATESEAFFPSSVAGGVGFTNFSLFPNTFFAFENTGSPSDEPVGSITEFGPAGFIIPGQTAIILYISLFIPKADLSVTVSGPDASIRVGSNLVFSLTISNAGPQAATGVTISNQLPANVDFVSATGVATLTNGAVLVALGPLDVGATETAQIVLRSARLGQFTNIFQVLATEKDPNTTNNSAAVVSRVDDASTAADLVLTAQGSSGLITVGSNFIYSLTISNSGPVPATGLVVSNQLPPNVHFLWATGVSRVNATDGSLLLNLGPLQSGASEQVQIFAQPTAPGGITNQFQVSANEADFNVSNNIATVVSTATSVLSGGGSPTLMMASPKSGQQLSNQITLEITGGTPGLNYVIEYSSNLFTWLPATPTFVASTNGVQWTDAGPPQTDSIPGKRGVRFYRAALHLGD